MGVLGSIFFSEHGHVAYETEGNDEYNRIQVKIQPTLKL